MPDDARTHKLFGGPAEQMKAAIASLALSGASLSPEDAADADLYATGVITLDGFRRRIFERYGIDPDGAA